ncbi:hypothetical protein THAOC_02765, partial [Thalassiosira oceanica]
SVGGEGAQEPSPILQSRLGSRNLAHRGHLRSKLITDIRNMDDDDRGSKRQRAVLDDVFLYEGGEIEWEQRSEITRVRIGPQVKDIPDGTFKGCINLTEVQFDEGSLEVIGECAFCDCKALQEVAILASVTKSLQEVAIPSSVFTLGVCAFEGCSKLAKVKLHEGLEIIEDSAFKDCKALQQVVLPSSVTDLGGDVFDGCINLATVKLNEGLQVVPSAFFECRALQKVVIPSSVTKLGAYAFLRCRNLASVHFSEGLEIIGKHAFDECSALRSVTVPSSVTKLGYGAFADCRDLAEVILLCGERLLNQGFLDRGLLDGEKALNKNTLNEMIGYDAFLRCPLNTLKISIPRALSERVERLPGECRLSIEQRVHDLRRLELPQDGNILACFQLIHGGSGWNSVEDTNDETAESLHQILQLISFHELKESSILIELAMWKSRLVEDRARADCRTSVPDPAKSLIMEYCGFADFLEHAIEGA